MNHSWLLRNQSVLVFFTLIGLLAFSGCAKEQSREERVREEKARKSARLQKAVGTFQGFVDVKDHGIIPAAVTISVQLNPSADGEENPVLQASLRLGLFGGVTIASSSSSFDWGNGQLSLSFAKAEGGKDKDGKAGRGGGKLELRALLKEGTLENAVLEGGKQGLFNMTLGRERKSLFSDNTEFTYLWRNDPPTEGVPFNAILRLKRLKENETPPPDSDLPDFPGFKASVLFPGIAKSPQVARQVLYDPLKGTLELYFKERSRVEFTEVFFRGTPQANAAFVAESTELWGDVFVGASSQQRAQLVRFVGKEPELARLPPRIFVGSYQGSGIPYRAVIYIDDSGSEGSNTEEFPFPSFPSLRLEMALCQGDEFLRRSYLKLASLDHLNSRALFRGFEAGGTVDFYMTFSQNWKKISGYVLKSDGVRPKISASERLKLGSNECVD